ncbi:Nif11-like leader peptide family natural product precursor [Synechococcus sp. UW105]|uniref:Nif11-like leader peptide family natural product precursor n=1 Tax=Synechococcus sp. UW105 TaxID=337067 RepID=UPI000E0E228C|nr:Nif11-like leader peptide family natural product precursor [Synechococcus sp. UW105]
MTVDQLKSFIEKVKNDRALQLRLKAVETDADWCAIAKEEGFSISVQDYRKGCDELTDEEMEGIAGGGTCWCGKTKKVCRFDSKDWIWEC